MVKKIGYLMYNAFTNEFDQALNNVFADFAAQGISDLVLDLRYNGGGSVKTATYLSGMITGQFNGQIFYNEQWNSDRQQVYASPGLFVNQMDNGTALNTLGLNRVYVLTSPSTASASELVINGLKPYIEVVQIGTATRGKFQASFLLYDAPAPSFTRSLANTGHRYAMLPLVFKTLNAAGVTDYADGLVPDIELSESLTISACLVRSANHFWPRPLLKLRVFPSRSSGLLRLVNTRVLTTRGTL
jgi:carboxyl-terminal processing protease